MMRELTTYLKVRNEDHLNLSLSLSGGNVAHHLAVTIRLHVLGIGLGLDLLLHIGCCEALV